jgi:hypothetical protein
MSILEDFLALSRILTGVAGLDEDLGRQYLDRLISSPHQPIMRQILETFRTIGEDSPLIDQVKRQIVGNDGFRPTVCQIMLLWYTAAVWDNPSSPIDPTAPINLRYGSQEEYFSGLAWQIIGAHVPGLSGGYFGHWRYRPDNEPREPQP